MDQRTRTPRRWVGMLAVGTIGFMMLYVQVTGKTLGELPHSQREIEQSQVVPGQVLAPGATENNPVLMADGGVALVIGSPQWLTIEFRTINLINTNESVQPASFEAYPLCKLVVVGQAGTFNGRVCETRTGVYHRLNEDGQSNGMALMYNEESGWLYVSLGEGEGVDEQTA